MNTNEDEIVSVLYAPPLEGPRRVTLLIGLLNTQPPNPFVICDCRVAAKGCGCAGPAITALPRRQAVRLHLQRPAGAIRRLDHRVHLGCILHAQLVRIPSHPLCVVQRHATQQDELGE